MTRRFVAALPVLLVAAIALTGCASTPAPAASSRSAQSLSPSPQPTSAEPAVDPTDPTAWIIGSASVGPLSIGEDLTQSTPTLARYELSPPELCPNPSMRIFKSPEYPTLWIVVDSQGLIESISVGGDAPAGVIPGSPRTAAGLGIGSPEADVPHAYPKAVKGNDFGIDHYSVVDGEGSGLVFGVHDGEVHTIHVDTSPIFKYEFCG